MARKGKNVGAGANVEPKPHPRKGRKPNVTVKDPGPIQR